MPFNMSEEQQEKDRAILGCQKTALPVTYLGMPLTICKSGRDLFAPLIQKLDQRLQGWKSKLISRGGRLQLVRSVLSSISVYFMTCFLLPKWVIKKIDRIRRQFLWGKNGEVNGGMSLINWHMACKHSKWGGMGILDLEIQNKALLLRWWWKPHTDELSIWIEVVNILKVNANIQQGPKLWIAVGSFFWKQLRGLWYLFNWCTGWEIGDGKLISFWFHAWQGLPLRNNRPPRPTRPNISLHSAIPIITDLLPNSPLLELPMLTQQMDVILWKWSTSGSYTAKSVYDKLSGGGMIRDRFSTIWKCKVPPTVCIFGFLALREKILTSDVLTKRGVRCQTNCVLCQRCNMETATHLFFKCSNALQVWREINRYVGHWKVIQHNEIRDIWEQSIQFNVQRAQYWSKAGPVLMLCVCCYIWNQRNGVIFQAARMKPPHVLAELICRQFHWWLKLC